MDAIEELKKIEAMMRRSSATGRSSSAEGVSEAIAGSFRATGHPEPIAIVGIAGAFPRCSSVADYWRALQADESLIDEIGAERFDWERWLPGHDRSESTNQCRWAGLIPRAYGFDAEFFSISAQEAELMDPRLRLLLMSIYHCLEDAGYAPERLKKSPTGLFIGVEESEYGPILHELGIDPGLANAPSMIANRIAYHFDFAGPSEFINTMCSSGAVALHRACNSLRSGEVSQAVVGAANVMVRPEPFWHLAEMGQLSTDKTIFSFGRQASGFLRADGVGSVLLKTLSQAKRDGDAIYALIKNSAVNFNGQGGVSMAAPNIAAHVNLIKKCYLDAGVDPRDIDYIEAQGMGTPVSDIAEWHAFNRALGDLARERKVEINDANCCISTVKPVTGHMHAASVFGALFKVILSLQSNTIYGIQSLSEISADLDQSNQPCKLLQRNAVWQPKKAARLAGIHSYGIGGNNAHLLIEECIAEAASTMNDATPSDRLYVIPFSARSRRQCLTLIEQCHRLLMTGQDHSLASIAHTLQVGRDTFEHRVAFLASSSNELTARMAAYLAGESCEGVFECTAVWQQPEPDSSDVAMDARKWVQGGRTQWQSLNDKVNPPRIRLPGYPFELTDYRAAHESVDSRYSSDRVRFSTIDADPALTKLEKISRFITLVVAQALHVPPQSMDPQREFQYLGVDSIITVKLMRAIHDELGVKLNGRELRELNSIGLLAMQVEKRTVDSPTIGHEISLDNSEGTDDDATVLEGLEKFRRGELDLSQIKELLN
jgi:polyketide synthase PksL